jgi:hypothetical protein
MTRHHERVRAVLLVHGLEADRRSGAGEGDTPTVVDLTARVTRVQAELDKVRSWHPGRRISDGHAAVDTGADADTWLLAVYDAALVELCTALGVGHALIHDGVCPESERQRVELELLSVVLPIG